MILSILIPTLYKRNILLNGLITELKRQIKQLNTNKVEILTYADNGEMPTGYKRNSLLRKAKGKYVVFIDDDDTIAEYYIEEILKGAESDCDSMAINGTMITGRRWTWDIRQSNPYSQVGSHFLRYPNHITPIKRKHAKKIKFPDKYIGEDFEWATKLKESGLLKTEYVIERPMYIYKPHK